MKEHTNLKIEEEDLLLEVLKILSVSAHRTQHSLNPIFFLMIYLNHPIPTIDD